MRECSVLSVGGNLEKQDDHIIYLKLFGSMTLTSSNGIVINLRGRKARAVLALLALLPGPVLRDVLIAKLWSRSERNKAQASLRHSIYEVQQALYGFDSSLLVVERHYLKLDHNLVKIDVDLVKSATAAEPEALSLMDGDLLEDLSGIDPAFNVWLENERRDISVYARTVAKALLRECLEPERRAIAGQHVLKLGSTASRSWQSLINGYTNADQIDIANSAVISQESDYVYSEIGSTLSRTSQAALISTPSKLSMVPSIDEQIKIIAHKKEMGTTRVAIMNFHALDETSLQLAHGLTNEIVVNLSKFRGLSCYLFETSRSLGRGLKELVASNVDFAIEGSVQQNAAESRITVHLADARNHGEIIWSQRFDRKVGNLLTIQNDVAAEIVAQIDPELMLRKSLRAERNQNIAPTSLDYILRALPAIYNLDRVKFIKSGEMLGVAVAQEPNNGAAHAWWAYWHLLLLGQGWADNPSDAEVRTWELARRAVSLDPGDARALALAGHVQAFTHRRIDEGMALHERALAINPNLPIAWLFSGLAHTYAGHHDEAIRRIRYARRLSPLDPHAFFFEMGLTLSLSLSGDDRQAVEHGRNAAVLNPSFSSTFKAYLSALGFVENQQGTKQILAQLLNLEPAFTISNALKRSPLVRQEDRAKFSEGLRLSGLPE